jgi:uncharacterized protein (DUF342 family)
MNPVSIHISDNRRNARISIDADELNFPSKDEIYTAIEKAGIVAGIDDTVIRDILTNKYPVNDVIFASSENNKNVIRDNLVWYIDLADYQKPKITVEGKADFKHLNQIELVKKNQELVSQVPHGSPQHCRLVTGEEILSDHNYFQSIKGKNVELSEDGLTLTAAIDGCAFWKSGKLNVDNIYHVSGDVDYRTGNIKFNGTVLIDGDVRSGFQVSASGSIFINGNVEAAEVFSENGDVIIKSGVLGKNRAKIQAGNNLHCRFLQDATVGVKNDVIIEHYAINSGISAAGKVFLIQNEGLIRGGKAFARDGMSAVEVGSPQFIATNIGISGSSKADEELKEWNLDGLISELKTKSSRILKKVEFLRLLEKRFNHLSAEKQADLVQSLREIDEIEERIKKIEEKKNIILKKSDEEDDRTIMIEKTIHKGVKITIGNLQYINDNAISGAKIYRRGDEIYIEKYGEKL